FASSPLRDLIRAPLLGLGLVYRFAGPPRSPLPSLLPFAFSCCCCKVLRASTRSSLLPRSAPRQWSLPSPQPACSAVRRLDVTPPPEALRCREGHLVLCAGTYGYHVRP